MGQRFIRRRNGARPGMALLAFCGRGSRLLCGLPLVALLVFLHVGSLPVRAGPFADAANSASNYSKRSYRSRAECRALRSITNADYTVVDAKLIGEGERRFCRVEVVIPAEIRAEILLPLQWNGRLFMQGNGGLAGTPPEDSGKRAFAQLAVDQGFAAAYTDTGHDRRVEPGGTFAYRRLDKLIDYGYRAIHLTNQTARRLIAEFYRKDVRKAYFFGCSTGGRQALMSAQRFPEDFDGVIAGAPANDYSGLKFSQAWRMSALQEQPLSPDEVLDLAGHIYARCDAQDGLQDGLLADPASCEFDVEQDLPLCTTDVDRVDCYTDAELSALAAYYAPVRLGNEVVYPGFLPGSEAADLSGVSGWIPWLMNDGKRPLLDLLGSDFFRYMAYVVDDPDFNWVNFDFQHAPDNLAQFRAIVDAIDPDLARFKANGGKLISYFGWADPDIHPLTAVNYRQQVAERVGDVDSFYALYMVPGMFHCRGGPGPYDFDVLTPLIDWVERGRAPGSLLASQPGAPDGGGAFTRPLCPHPQRAVFNGVGDVSDANSFSCEKPAAAR